GGRAARRRLVVPRPGLDPPGEPCRDARDAAPGLHPERARSGTRRPSRGREARVAQRDDPDADHDRPALWLDAGRNSPRRERLRLAGHRPLRGELGALVRLRAGHGRHPRHRLQLHARESARRSRLRVARPAPPTDGGVNARVQSLAFRGWWEDRATAAREARRYARIFSRNVASVAGLGLVVAFLLMALVRPFVVPYPEDATGTVHLDRKLEAPRPAPWFCPDQGGHNA